MPRSQVNPLRETVRINGEIKTFHQLRQEKYERIVDETLFISRASEGAVSAEWVMDQPIFIREKYVKSFEKELKERQAQMEKNAKK